MGAARRLDGGDDGIKYHGRTGGARRGAALVLPPISVFVSVYEDFVAVPVVRPAWMKVLIVKNFADRCDKVLSSFKSYGFRCPLGLRVSSLSLSLSLLNSQQTDASSIDEGCARLALTHQFSCDMIARSMHVC
jgi:hypothetical protein